jgi:hypothetical protein
VLTLISTLAQTAPVSGNELSSLMTVLNLGLAGVGLLAFVRGWIVPGKSHQEALDRARRAEEKLQLLSTDLNDRILPEMQHSRAVQQGLGHLVERVMDFVEREENRTNGR